MPSFKSEQKNFKFLINNFCLIDVTFENI